jgi:hypothetical protein
VCTGNGQRQQGSGSLSLRSGRAGTGVKPDPSSPASLLVRVRLLYDVITAGGNRDGGFGHVELEPALGHIADHGVWSWLGLASARADSGRVSVADLEGLPHSLSHLQVDGRAAGPLAGVEGRANPAVNFRVCKPSHPVHQ